MRSGLFQQLRSFFSKEKREGKPVLKPQMADNNALPSFSDLKPKNGLPSFKELQAAKHAKSQAQGGAVKKKKEKVVRPRRAKTLDVFRAQSPGGHALFYRYIRLTDEKNDGLAGPKGGACILVKMLSDSQFAFSFSVCSPEDPFIKDEARRLCQERMSPNMLSGVSNRDRNVSCYENIFRAIENHFQGLNTTPGEPTLSVGKDVTPQQLKLLVKFIRANYFK